MRNVILIIIIICCADIASAQRYITREDAVTAATNKVNQLFPHTNRSAIQVDTLKSESGEVILYEVSMNDETAVLLSGVRAYTPILAVYKKPIGTSILRGGDGVPDGAKMLVASYKLGIQEALSQAVENETFSIQWDNLTAETASREPTRAIAPLLTSRWGEKASNDGMDDNAYNYFCQEIDGCKPPVGSAAVAMGQLMYYWQYPFFSIENSVRFDWCRMGDELRVSDPLFEEKKHAIATLLWNCSMASRTRYGCSYSESSTSDVKNALIEQFLFKTNQNYVPCPPWPAFGDDLGAVLLTEFFNELVTNIEEGRPVLCYGKDINGKQVFFLCDGHAGDFNFHFNWGMVGGDFDGVYNIVDEVSFYYLMNIRPKLELSFTDLYLSDFYDQYLTSDWNVQPYHFVPSTAARLFSAEEGTNPAWRTIPTGETSVYQAQEEVVLQEGFEAEWGSVFTAEIVPCRGSRGEVPVHHLAQADTTDNRHYASAAPDIQLPQVELFPNPTDGPLTVETDGMATAIVVYDLMGRPIGGWQLDALTKTHATLDVSSLRPGAYLLAVQTETGTKTARFVRK